jgi:hypothetical protein
MVSENGEKEVAEYGIVLLCFEAAASARQQLTGHVLDTHDETVRNDRENCAIIYFVSTEVEIQ